MGSSFVGNIANPIIDARLKLSLSANALARRLGFSRQYISKAEQGTYSQLNPALTLWVANALQIEKGDVNRRYVAFQRATRNATKDKINPHTLRRQEGNTDAGWKIFEHWRAGYWPSHLSFSSAFCIHPETVKSYEDGLRKEMPPIIRQALTELDLIDPQWTEVFKANEKVSRV